jgi:Zn-dependent protease with chaperone function
MATSAETYGVRRPAARAQARVLLAGVAVALLGLSGSALVIVRLLESWRVGPHYSAHHVTILGQRFLYPTANVDAILILALAVIALFALALGLLRGVREVVATARLRRALQRRIVGERDGALLIDDPVPLAFCLGLARPRVYISTGAVEILSLRALDAVLGHERHHAARRDPLRNAIGRVVAATLFHIPGVESLARRQRSLSELSADESVAEGPGGRSALAQAILAFDAASATSVDPSRVDHLVGEPISWRFPAAACGVAIAVIALLAGLAALAGRVASGSATLAPPFLSSQPCILALAVIPVIAVLALAVRIRLQR